MTATAETDSMVWRRDLRAYFGDVSDETVRRWIKQGKLPKPDVDLSLRNRGWKLSTLQKAGIRLVVPIAIKVKTDFSQPLEAALTQPVSRLSAHP